MNEKVEDHGNFKHGLTEHPLYKVWASMKNRCKNDGKARSVYHGSRGITICNEWQEFMPFYLWSINNGYKKGLTLDRINNDGNYEPFNCRYTTYSIQNHNRRKPQRMPRYIRDIFLKK